VDWNCNDWNGERKRFKRLGRGRDISKAGQCRGKGEEKYVCERVCV
jgi:hypothetical protein